MNMLRKVGKMRIDKDIELLKKIKLIIWDLDDTFWNGTLSEGPIEFSETNCDLVKALSARGVVNSICSKNDKTMAVEQLSQIDIWDYFIFASINWEAKGNRIKQILLDMGLRAENVLFLDDNVMNLQEAEYYNPDLMVSTPDIIPFISEYVDELGKDDSSLSRLRQYQTLEKKVGEKASFSSNEEFLKESNIRVAISRDCGSEIKRIYEMIHRTNQLNFTKNRITQEQLQETLNNPEYDCGYVKVSDKFGEYGIVGFFCLDKIKNKLIHFLFSCRTMGMGIEQYVYEFLRYPEISIIEPVSGELSKEAPSVDYIQYVDDFREEKRTETTVKILLKGPCDLEILASYLKKNGDIDTEFNFVDDRGQQVDYYNHLVQIRNTQEMKQKDIKDLVNKYGFLSESAFKTNIFSGEYDIICLSVLMDSTLGVYRNKDTGLLMPYGLYSKSLTDSGNWSEYINKKVMTARSEISEEQLQQFAEEYEKIDYSAQLFGENLEWVINRILEKNKNTKIILLLLSELPYTIPMKHNEPLIGKEKIHADFNREMLNRFQNNENVRFIYVNEMIRTQEDYFDNINHYSKLVYYKMAQDFIEILNELNVTNIQTISKIKAVVDNIIRMYVKIKFRLLKDRI